MSHPIPNTVKPTPPPDPTMEIRVMARMIPAPSQYTIQT